MVNYPYDDEKGGHTRYSESPDDKVFQQVSRAYSQVTVSCWNNVWWIMENKIRTDKTSGFLWNPWRDKVWELDYNGTHCWASLVCDVCAGEFSDAQWTPLWKPIPWWIFWGWHHQWRQLVQRSWYAYISHPFFATYHIHVCFTQEISHSLLLNLRFLDCTIGKCYFYVENKLSLHVFGVQTSLLWPQNTKNIYIYVIFKLSQLVFLQKMY